MKVGIIKLLQSAKGTGFLLTLAVSGTALLLGKLDGVPFAAIVATVFAVFSHNHTKTDMASMTKDKQ